MQIQNIERVELEISSDCNAACPGCARTQNLDILKPQNLTLQQIKDWFPNPKGIKFKFCGVLGDPIVNPECLEITQYLVEKGAFIQYSTNGGRNSASWWDELGKLGIKVNFCVDGTQSNYIYRVNTNFDIIKRNMKAYSEAGGQATWIYIVFDHNEHEVDEAKKLATEYGFDFATRTGMRNSYHNWVSKIGKKNDKKDVVITTSGAKEHSKKAVIDELDKFIKDENKSEQQTKEILSSIDCKFYHGKEIFIAANSTVWPCCFLWDSAFKNKEQILDKYKAFPVNWNNLQVHSLNEILNTEYYQKVLQDSWDPTHNLHISRCIRTCAKKGAYQNEIKFHDK
jgi:MoaA/NifB/PqqE/SkfB family radical SAM enzyme